MRPNILAIVLLIRAQAATAADIRFVSSAENDIQANDAPNCNLRPSGTMIEYGSRCESACALAFMAGVYPEEGNAYPWRMIHPGGRLGFHAPDRRLPAGQYNEAGISRAYRIALKSVSQTVEKRVMAGTGRTRRMRPSLLAAMLATPSDALCRYRGNNRDDE